MNKYYFVNIGAEVIWHPVNSDEKKVMQVCTSAPHPVENDTLVSLIFSDKKGNVKVKAVELTPKLTDFNQGYWCALQDAVSNGASDAKKISKVIFSDINIPMLELCCKNTLSISTDNYLGKVPLFYVKENICEPKFFESSTVVVTHGVLEHFSDVDITRIMSTYNNDKVLFQAHYVPTSQYTSPSFGDERLLPTDYWITLVKPDYYLLDNNGKDLYMFKTKPAPTRR